MPMLMVHPRNIDTLSRDMHSLLMEGRSHGARKSKSSSHYQLQRPSISHPPMQLRRPSGSIVSSAKSLNCSVIQSPFYNQSAIALTKDGNYHARTKHIDIRYHFIRFSISNGSICLLYCPTDSMVADTLTKALPSSKAKHFASELGLRAI